MKDIDVTFKSWINCVYKNSAISPDKICMVDKKGSITYKEYLLCVRKMASFFISQKIKHTNKIICRSTQSIDHFIVHGASILVKAVFVPLEESVSKERIKEVAESFPNTALIIGNEEDRIEGIRFLDLKNIRRTCSFVNDEYPVVDIERVDDRSVGQILFTTGSTGKSKGVMTSNLVFTGTMISGQIWGVYPWLNQYVLGPVNHFGPLFWITEILTIGGTVMLSPGLNDIVFFKKCLDEYKVNSIAGTPSAMNILYELCHDEFGKYTSQIKEIKLGGEKCTLTVQKKLLKQFPNSDLRIHYGSTECGHIAAGLIKEELLDNDYIGYIDPVAEAYIAEDSRLRVKTPYRMLGYVNDDEEYNKVKSGDCLYTGDRGEIRNGILYILSRVSDTIVSGGMKVNPYEVEEAAVACDEIDQCICVGKPNELVGMLVTLFVKLAPGVTMSVGQVKKLLRTKMENYKVPKEIYFIDEIKTNANGKIDRKYYREVVKND